ncbi:MAG TPA: hypothetical protein VN207_06940 [Ktedonobacteraceae bacterium]|nr:hypothetical protein [Ktedonobacteraceae bacterium]
MAKNLASGHGFTEDFIITYLTPATSVVHPSNLYWMPLTSIIIAPFLALFGISWRIAQIPIILLSVSLPLLAYWISWDIFRSRRYAFAIALFTLLGSSVDSFYFLATDSFALYGWLSSLALVGMYHGWRGHPWRFALAGIAIGLAHLARSDGVLLLVVGCLIWLCSQKKSWRGTAGAINWAPTRHAINCQAGVVPRFGKAPEQIYWKSSDGSELHPIPWQALLGMCGFYLLTMAPWFLRNIAFVGSPLPTWGTMTMWFTSYNDFFTFHKAISAQVYLSWGWRNILFSKLLGLGENYLIVNQLVYIPFVFVIFGMWVERKRAELLPFLIYLLILYSVFSLIFTFLGVHGSLLHSTVGLLPFLYGWGLVGMETTIAYIIKRLGKKKLESQNLLETSTKSSLLVPENEHASSQVYRSRKKEIEKRVVSLVLVIAIGFSATLSGKNIFDTNATWNQDYLLYQKVGEVVARDYREHRNIRSPAQPIVMAGDSADYYYATGQHAVLLPAQDLATVLDAAQTYSVSYILFVPDQGDVEARLWRKTLTDRRLKLIWTWPRGKLYRFLH